MATLAKTPPGTWKAVIRKAGWSTTSKTFRIKRNAEGWARRTEDDMVHGIYVQRSAAHAKTRLAQWRGRTGYKRNPHEARAMWQGFLWSPRLYQPLLDVFKPSSLGETAA